MNRDGLLWLYGCILNGELRIVSGIEVRDIIEFLLLIFKIVLIRNYYL